MFTARKIEVAGTVVELPRSRGPYRQYLSEKGKRRNLVKGKRGENFQGASGQYHDLPKEEKQRLEAKYWINLCTA